MFKKLEPVNVWHFYLKTDWNDESSIKIVADLFSSDGLIVAALICTPRTFLYACNRWTGSFKSQQVMSQGFFSLYALITQLWVNGVNVSQAWWLSVNQKKTRVVCLSLLLSAIVGSEGTVFLIQQGNSYCAAELWKPLPVLSRVTSRWFRSTALLRLCQTFERRCRTITGVDRFLRTLHRIAFLSQRCSCGPGCLLSSPARWLEHKEHSSAVNQRTKVTDSTPN